MCVGAGIAVGRRKGAVLLIPSHKGTPTQKARSSSQRTPFLPPPPPPPNQIFSTSPLPRLLCECVCPHSTLFSPPFQKKIPLPVTPRGQSKGGGGGGSYARRGDGRKERKEGRLLFRGPLPKSTDATGGIEPFPTVRALEGGLMELNPANRKKGLTGPGKKLP